jgi:putative transposase
MNVNRPRQRYQKGEGAKLSDGAAERTMLRRLQGPDHIDGASLLLPLTISDEDSSHFFCCEALSSTRARLVFMTFEHMLKEWGLASVIRTDDGVPFASASCLFGLSKLSV